VVGRLDCIDDAGVDLKSDGTESQSSIDADKQVASSWCIG